MFYLARIWVQFVSEYEINQVKSRLLTQTERSYCDLKSNKMISGLTSTMQLYWITINIICSVCRCLVVHVSSTSGRWYCYHLTVQLYVSVIQKWLKLEHHMLICYKILNENKKKRLVYITNHEINELQWLKINRRTETWQNFNTVLIQSLYSKHKNSVKKLYHNHIIFMTSEF